ncbi:hypothetical protein [Paraburkholderia terricola]|uniref:hypothetical protein n=1 Tax=Paraburkholderia terricola TaxID=169427 RepID=UPI0028551917|nr:hypothetical protein [Paraburkholderia terricola]MDR6484609.1 hypothetical protein [Paraburkholderia terricola]
MNQVIAVMQPQFCRFALHLEKPPLNPRQLVHAVRMRLSPPRIIAPLAGSRRGKQSPSKISAQVVHGNHSPDRHNLAHRRHPGQRSNGPLWKRLPGDRSKRFLTDSGRSLATGQGLI